MLCKIINFKYIHDNDITVNAVVQSSIFRIDLSISLTILKKTVELVCGDM